mmetsp:Transcript_25822/g.27762  ORF Transcript_25822/g.27762 Transcript_25822/m.27762 type:complete len:117 (+) Transcript_25822:200-550(+)
MSKIFPKRSCQRILGGKAACRTVRPLPVIGAVSVPGDPGAVDDDSVDTDGLDHNFVVVDTARNSVPAPSYWSCAVAVGWCGGRWETTTVLLGGAQTIIPTGLTITLRRPNSSVLVG